MVAAVYFIKGKTSSKRWEHYFHTVAKRYPVIWDCWTYALTGTTLVISGYRLKSTPILSGPVGFNSSYPLLETPSPLQ